MCAADARSSPEVSALITLMSRSCDDCGIRWAGGRVGRAGTGAGAAEGGGVGVPGSVVPLVRLGGGEEGLEEGVVLLLDTRDGMKVEWRP